MLSLILVLAFDLQKMQPHRASHDPKLYCVEVKVDRSGIVGSTIYLFVEFGPAEPVDTDDATLFVNGIRWKGKSWDFREKFLVPGRWNVRLTKHRDTNKITKAEFFGG